MPYIMLQGMRKKAKQRQERREAIEVEAELVTGTSQSVRRKSARTPLAAMKPQFLERRILEGAGAVPGGRRRGGIRRNTRIELQVGAASSPRGYGVYRRNSIFACGTAHPQHFCTPRSAFQRW